MQNLTASKGNVTRCGLCSDSPITTPAYLTYIVISLPANSWVLRLMISSPAFWTNRMEVSEFHLVLTELLFAFIGPSLLTVRYFSQDLTADAMMKLIYTIFTARIQFQTSVSMERYFAVVHPVLYLRYKVLRYKMSFCCVIWVETVLIGIGQMFLCSEDEDAVSMHTTSFFLAFIINTFCCLSVLRALKKPSPKDGDREGSNLIKKRAFNIVLIFQVTTVVGYLPLVIMYLLVKKIKFQTLCIWQPLAYSWMIWLGVIHPLLYLRRAGKHLVFKNYLCTFSGISKLEMYFK